MDSFQEAPLSSTKEEVTRSKLCRKLSETLQSLTPIFSAGLGARDLRQAEEWAVKACRMGSGTAAAWKLLGDVYVAYRLVDPVSEEQSRDSHAAADMLAL